MLFWVIAAALTIAASLAVLLPLARGARTAPRAEQHELEVYRDQLAELERDAARGLIGGGELEEARTEIGRRILRAAGSGNSGGEARMPALGRVVGTVAVLAVPLVSWGIYTQVGSPDLPGQPLAARLTVDPARESIEELLARAETHLAANPRDGRGWDVVAPVYLRLGRFDESVRAYRAAIDIVGASAERLSGLGEALTSVGGGVVNDEARAAFEKAASLDAADVRAHFYLATALAQQGDLDAAATAWQTMLPALPQGSAWRGAVEEALKETARRKLAAAQPGPGPTAAEVDAASEMSTGDRTAMIETMVAGLDQKLRENPDDLEGWKRLVRSYMVLEKASEARSALERGLAALKPDSAGGRDLAAFAATIGLTATE